MTMMFTGMIPAAPEKINMTNAAVISGQTIINALAIWFKEKRLLEDVQALFVLLKINGKIIRIVRQSGKSAAMASA